MTLSECVKSGKPFRHKNHSTWFDLMKCNFKPGEYELNELISDDWEIQQKETFTREDVERGIKALYDKYHASYSFHETWRDIFWKAAEAI